MTRKFSSIDEQGTLWTTQISKAEEVTISIKGIINWRVVGPLEKMISEQSKKFPTLHLDLSLVTSVDSAGCAFLNLLKSASEAGNSPLSISGISGSVGEKLELFASSSISEPEPPARAGAIEGIGAQVIQSASQFQEFLQLSADSTLTLVRGLFRGGIIRWNDLVSQGVLIGSQALPIVGLIALLIGLTLAFQSAHQLRSFGVDVFVAKLTGIALIREMAPLMTAIIVAGRSGASIAAEVATMKVSEEIDALKVMGIDPVSYLAVPRLLAILITLPLLTVYADLIGIAGGFLVGVSYVGLAPVVYINQTLESLVLGDVMSGLFKSVIFAWGIGMIGLSYGFRTRGGSEEVGKSTTASVVASIFYIIVADCIFSIIFYVIL